MKKVAVLLSIIVFLLAFSTTRVQGQKESINFSKKIVTVSEGEVINRDFFAGANTVEISGTVNGDVYTAGGQIFVDGIINGDLLIAGGTVNISGVVSQNVRAAAGNILISGDVGRNVSVVAGNIELLDSGTIGGNFIAGAGNIVLNSRVLGDVQVASGNLTLANTVGGDVNAKVDSLRVTSKGQILGNLTYWSEEDASIDSQASIVGTTTQNKTPVSFKADWEGKKLGRRFLSGARIFSAITTFILGLLFIYLFPKFTDNSLTALRKNPWGSLGWGVVSLIVVLVLIVILSITIIGIPLAILTFIVYLLILYFARIIVIYYLGTSLLERVSERSSTFWAYMFGLLIYLILTYLHIIGGLTTFLVTMFGIGAVILTRQKKAVTQKATSKRKK